MGKHTQWKGGAIASGLVWRGQNNITVPEREESFIYFRENRLRTSFLAFKNVVVLTSASVTWIRLRRSKAGPCSAGECSQCTRKPRLFQAILEGPLRPLSRLVCERRRRAFLQLKRTVHVVPYPHADSIEFQSICTRLGKNDSDFKRPFFPMNLLSDFLNAQLRSSLCHSGRI